MTDWPTLTWTETRAAEAVSALASAAGLTSQMAMPALFERAADGVDYQIEATAEALGLDALAVELTYGDIMRDSAQLAPALIRVALDPALPLSQPEQLQAPTCVNVGYLAVVRCTHGRISVLGPDLTVQELDQEQLHERLTRTVSAQPAALIDTWLEQAQIPARRWGRARRRLLTMLLGETAIGGIWILRREPSARLSQLLGAVGWFRLARVFLVSATLHMLVVMAAWSVLARAVLGAEIAPGYLQAWLLLGCTAIPCQVLTVWAGGRSGLRLAMVLKQRLLCGALRIDARVIRDHGSGGLLAMVDECEAVERAGLDGTFAAFAAVVQLGGAAVVLALGAGGILHVILLVGWCAVVALLSRRVVQRLRGWTDQRFQLSKLFVERVQGHRTRLAQGAVAHWHTDEDLLVASYAQAARDLDRARIPLAVLPARGWLVLASLGLVPVLLSAPTPVALALTLGGMLQAQHAFARLSQTLAALLEAAVAWRSVRPLFHAARALPAAPGGVVLPACSAAGDSKRAPAEPATLVDLRSVSFRYGESPRLVLRECSLTMKEGERWLLDGASGSGKSTLAKVLTGMCKPGSGLLLLDGLDYATLGAREWRRRIASAPQFHENHLLSAPLSFNLLMGRCWPPSPADLSEALTTCRALGLGPLIQRMPSGLHQIVGETGWQLSHGERSRVFLARALLQHASVVVLDESFGALDPDTLKLCMRVVRERANALLVIAHP